jgi:hypothetical protein
LYSFALPNKIPGQCPEVSDDSFLVLSKSLFIIRPIGNAVQSESLKMLLTKILLLCIIIRMGAALYAAVVAA